MQSTSKVAENVELHAQNIKMQPARRGRTTLRDIERGT